MTLDQRDGSAGLRKPTRRGRRDGRFHRARAHRSRRRLDVAVPAHLAELGCSRCRAIRSAQRQGRTGPIHHRLTAHWRQGSARQSGNGGPSIDQRRRRRPRQDLVRRRPGPVVRREGPRRTDVRVRRRREGAARRCRHVGDAQQARQGREPVRDQTRRNRAATGLLRMEDTVRHAAGRRDLLSEQPGGASVPPISDTASFRCCSSVSCC